MLVQSLSGVRGIFGKSLTPDVASKYAAAYFSVFKPKTVVIGMDTRNSGPAIKTVMVNALSCKIIDVGIFPTPAIQNAVRHFKADGGIIITASHNPPEWNGFKFLRKDGSVLYEQEMAKVIIQYQKTASKTVGKPTKTTTIQKRAEAIEAYKGFLFSIIGKNALGKIKKLKIKIIADPNGGAGIIAPDILEAAGISVEALHMEPGDFSRQIEPTEDSLAYLVPKIKQHKAAFAAGFDCDADRVEIVLPNGKMLSGNEMIALTAQHILKHSKNAGKETVVVNNATSSQVRDVVQKHKAKLIEVEVGEANVIQSMKRLKSKVGGEGSSSGVILSPATSRDGTLAVLLMATFVAAERKSLGKLLGALPAYHYLKEKVAVEPSKMPILKKTIENYYKKKAMKLQSNQNGAIKAWMTKDSFVWFRDSKTENGIMRVIVDAPSKKEATFLMQEAFAFVKSMQ